MSYLHIYCNTKVVSNVYIFLTFATMYKYCVNAVFTIFTLYANLHFMFEVNMKFQVLSKYDQI